MFAPAEASNLARSSVTAPPVGSMLTPPPANEIGASTAVWNVHGPGSVAPGRLIGVPGSPGSPAGLSSPPSWASTLPSAGDASVSLRPAMLYFGVGDTAPPALVVAMAETAPTLPVRPPSALASPAPGRLSGTLGRAAALRLMVATAGAGPLAPPTSTPPWLLTAPAAPSDEPSRCALATWLTAPATTAGDVGRLMTPVRGRLSCPSRVTSSGFCTDWVPGAVARASCTSASDSSDFEPTVPSMNRPTDWARNGVAALARPPAAALARPPAATASPATAIPTASAAASSRPAWGRIG